MIFFYYFVKSSLLLIELHLKFLIKIRPQLPHEPMPLINVDRSGLRSRLPSLQKVETILPIQHHFDIFG